MPDQTDHTRAERHDLLSHLISAIVPTVPNLDVQKIIRCIFGTVGPGQNDRHMEHWGRGKTIQSYGGDVPKKHEAEHAVGLYDQEIRPVLIKALLEWARNHGTEDNHKVVPNCTNRLLCFYRGYRIEGDAEGTQVEVYRASLERLAVWSYGSEIGDGEGGIPTIQQVHTRIDRDIEEMAG